MSKTVGGFSKGELHGGSTSIGGSNIGARVHSAHSGGGQPSAESGSGRASAPDAGSEPAAEYANAKAGGSESFSPVSGNEEISPEETQHLNNVARGGNTPSPADPGDAERETAYESQFANKPAMADIIKANENPVGGGSAPSMAEPARSGNKK